ncbi:MAG: LLM class flavin-dependent oxidoreductase [Mycobacterium sp.]|uniref:LLM class flavin-dependent oxidoreductase n=1 Tax=Mycobacterium sp. TaxID=1785 RepID=UPI003BB00060
MFTLRFDMRSPAWAAAPADLYAAAIDMCAWAETRGAIVAVLSEHHGADDGHLPSPLTLASAIAARTEQLMILLAAVPIPLCDPVRLAEEMTVLDLISKGRVMYACGIGHRREEYEHFGLSMATRGRVADEILDVLDDLLHGKAVEYRGGASLYASGIFPGFASDQLALLMTTQSRNIRSITASEVALNDHYPVADVMMDGMGFGRPLDFEPTLKTPGFIEIAWKAPIYLMAKGLGVEIEEVRGYLDRQLSDRDIEVAFGTIPAGTCGAVRTRAAGVVDGQEAIVIEHVIRMARDVAPDWPRSECDATYRVDIVGDPDIHCAMTLGEAEGHGAGRAAMTSTAMRVVNAIPYVVDAAPGLLSSLDIPMTLPRHVFD